jgi:hypothetical protein
MPRLGDSTHARATRGGGSWLPAVRTNTNGALVLPIETMIENDCACPFPVLPWCAVPRRNTQVSPPDPQELAASLAFAKSTATRRLQRRRCALRRVAVPAAALV